MKTITRLVLAFAALAAFLAVSATSLHAADESPPAAATLDAATGEIVATGTSVDLTWQQSLIVVLTPLIIAGLKKVVPSVPKGILPVLAPICGALLEMVSHLTTGSTVNVWAALALGAAGVGLREVVKQTRSAMSPSPSPGIA